MKKSILTLCLALPLLAQTTPPAAQAPRPRYDLTKELSIQGTVKAVNTLAMGPGKMISLTLQTGDKSIELIVAPDFLLEAKHLSFTVGDKVSALCAPAGERFKARQITRGSDSLTLLDKNGEPVNKPKPYDATKESTLQGEVVAVSTRKVGPGNRVFLTLKTGDKTTEVALAPDSTLKENHFIVGLGDRVSVIAAPGGPKGDLVARQLIRTMDLLDKDGKALERPAQAGPDGAPRK